MPAASSSPARWWSATRARRSRSRRRPTTGPRRCSASAGCAICAPPIPASPAPMRARWSTNGSRCESRNDPVAWRPDVMARRIISWLTPGDAGARRFRRALLSPLHAQPHPPGAPPAARSAPMRATACRACRPRSRSPTRRCACRARRATSSARPSACRDELRAPDPARRRPYQPQSRRADRAAGRSPAAAPGLHRAQHPAAAGAAQRHRPHDADAALLPARRRQFRAVQRHGPDADRSAHHHPRL